ncbi:MAG TPA: hypothetical protein VJ032_09390 [Thermoanaerobaculia bacterium]|nr:hypothetical protein [Thermoanaerobaculia bacterium]
MAETPLLVISCDRYADLWEPFFAVFRARWPDCPFPLFLGTNHKRCEIEGVTTIDVGDDVSWSSGVRAMIDRLDSDYAILFLEDFLLKEPVNTPAVERLVRVAREHHTGSLRLSPLPPPTPLPSRHVDGIEDLGIVQPGDAYRVSTQPAIWRLDTLRKLLLPGFSAWDFEHLGTQLSAQFDDTFWGPFSPAVVYDHGVEKGKWKPEGIEICRSAGVEPDLNVRPAFTQAELDAHLAAAIPAMDDYALRRDATDAFARGRRVEGLRLAMRGLRKTPRSIPLWTVVPFGVAGPRAIAWLQRRVLRGKIASARRAYDRKLAEKTR